MIPYYDIEEAAKRLEVIALERLNSAHSGIQISRIASVAARYDVVAMGKVQKLAHRIEDDPSRPYEEVTALFQGVIVKHDLPPFTEKIGRTSGQAKFLRQSVTIGGLGTATFEKVVNVISEIHSTFVRTVGKEMVEDCTMITTHHENSAALELSNRYFTFRTHNTPGNDKVELTNDIDPHGYLAQAAPSGFYHGEENVVAYFIREGTSDENYKYIPTKPVVFSTGDIVEVHAAFVAVPLKNDRFKTMMILRGLTLIDGTLSQSARSKQNTNRPTNKISNAKTIVKRKISYHEEEVSAARAKMGRLNINSGDQGHDETDEMETVEHELGAVRETNGGKGKLGQLD